MNWCGNFILSDFRLSLNLFLFICPTSIVALHSPFATLVGYDDAVKETARLTNEKLELTADKITDLNQKIAFLTEHADERPEITIEYFIPDEKKSGGKYVTLSGNFRCIDEYNQNMVFVSGEEIPLNDIFDIEI